MPIVGTKELADAAGVSRQRIWQWERDDGMPGKLSRGKWDSEVALPWIAERRPDTVPDSPEQAQTLNDLRCRLTGLQADAQELRNGILAGNLLLRDSVENANREEYAALISEGDTWVSEGRTAHDQALRRELWNASPNPPGRRHRAFGRYLRARRGCCSRPHTLRRTSGLTTVA